MRQASSRTIVPLIAVFIVCALASAAIWLGAGIINTRAGGDSPFLLVRAFELTANLRAGVFPARWMPDATYGLGYPFFNFYASLPYYLAALLNVLGVDLIVAIKLTQTLGMFAAAMSMWLFARRMLNPWGSALAAGAYVLAPFHLVNVYVRGDSLSEFWAFVWYPLILWSIHGTIESCRGKAAGSSINVNTFQPTALPLHTASIILALSLAGLVLTHNVSALLFAPFIVIYALALLIHQTRHSDKFVQNFFRGAIALMLPALLALALSAWFWLPALSESSSAQLGEQTTGYFNYANHFREGNLVQRSPAFNYAVNESGDAFSMGLVQAILIALGSTVWLFSELRTRNPERGTQARLFSFFLLLSLFALSTFMMLPASGFIWENAPLLKLAQFPWRMLSVQAVFASVLIGGIGGSENGDRRLATEHTHPNRQSPITIAFSLFSLLLLTWSALAQLPNARLNVQGSDVTPASIQFYEWYTGNIGSTIRAEYLPKTAVPLPRVGPALMGMQMRAFLAQDGAPATALTSHLQSQSPAQQTWRIQATQSLSIVLPLIYTPAWQAQLNGNAIVLAPHAGSGWASMNVPAGEHTLVLTYAGTALQHTGNALSLVALLLLMGAAAVIVVRANAAQRRRALSFAGIIAVCAIALWLMGALLNPQQKAPALQSIDFNVRPFPHRDPVIFSHDNARYELIGASIAPAQVQAGEPFTLSLKWKNDLAPDVITVTQELPSGGEFMSLFRHARQQTTSDPRISTHIALTDALPSPLLIKVQAGDANSQSLDAINPDGSAISTLIAGKITPAITLIGPTITGTPQTSAEITAQFSNGIAMHRFDWFYSNSQTVCFRPQWSLQREDAPRADALQVSLRLRGNDGRLIAQADSQPQGGLAPTWSWQKGVLVYDSQCVPAQGLLEAGESYTIEIVWYRVSDLKQNSAIMLRGARGPVMEDLNVPAQ